MSDYNLSKFDLSRIPDGAVCAMVGSRGTGKTTILNNIMFSKRRIPDGIGCSGTEESNGNLSAFMPESYIYCDYNPEAVARAVNRARYQNKLRTKTGLPKKFSFIIIDDCACDDAFTKDKVIRRILMNGRHYGIFFLFTMQYPLSVLPNMRDMIDFVFICGCSGPNNRKRLFDNYAAVVPSLPEFTSILEAVCQNFRCLVIAQHVPSNKLEDRVFHFTADPQLPKFRVGSQLYWQAHFDRFNPHYDDEDEEHQFDADTAINYEFAPKKSRSSTRNKYKATVRLLD